MSAAIVAPATQHDKNTQFHAGEIEVQRRRGSGALARSLVVHGGMIKTRVDPAKIDFIEGLSFLVISVLDSRSGRVWASIAQGSPNGTFIKISGDGKRASVALSAFATNDPLLEVIEASQPSAMCGVVAMAPESRRRARFNGRARLADTRLEIDIDASFGNCPKYIRARQVSSHDHSKAADSNTIRERRGLSTDEIEWVRQADTMFVGSAEKFSGADASHRGGRPGFVRVDDTGRTLSYGEYPGNGLAQTLGNILAHGYASLVLVDFKTGSILQLSGFAQIQFPTSQAESLDGTDCIVVFKIDEVARVNRTEPVVRFEVQNGEGESPFNPRLTGPGAPVASFGAREGLTVVLEEVHEENADGSIKTFWFRPEHCAPDDKSKHDVLRRLKSFQPGEYATFSLANLDTVRSWTITSFPDNNTGKFSISVKRKPGGLVSNWLHDKLEPGNNSLAVLGVDGGGQISAFMDWLPQKPVPIYQKVLMISAGVGITPMLANLRAIERLAKDTKESPVASVRLLHTDKTLATTAAVDELRRMHQRGILSSLTVVETFGDSSRRMNRHHVEQALPHDRIASILLCGPDPFMKHVKDILIDDLGVNPSFIHTETFSF